MSEMRGNTEGSSRSTLPDILTNLVEFRVAGFPGTSKPSVRWGPLQAFGVHDERSESVIYCTHAS